jgi:hypothetical protein
MGMTRTKNWMTIFRPGSGNGCAVKEGQMFLSGKSEWKVREIIQCQGVLKILKR